MDIFVAGDYYVAADLKPEVDRSLLELIRSADHALVNLEAPATESPVRIPKSGPHLTMDPSQLVRVHDLGFSMVTLANNHILDAGMAGLAETLTGAAASGLRTVGASTTPQGARTAGVERLESAGVWVSVLNYCEHEWSVQQDGAGANPWDVLAAFEDVQMAREQGDRVLVVLHGGNEYFPLPRPTLRRELRFLADHGADAIVMHHSHVAAAYEVWHGVPIFYGLGNFQFTLPSSYSGWYDGLSVTLRIGSSGPAGYELHPITQSREFQAQLATGALVGELRRGLEGLQLVVQADAALEARWHEFLDTISGGLLEGLAPSSRIPGRLPRRVVERAWRAVLERDAATVRFMTNLFQCESHREALRDILRSRVATGALPRVADHA